MNIYNPERAGGVPMLRGWLLSTFVGCVSLIPGLTQESGSPVEGGITGTVITQGGQVASGAKACLAETSGNDTTTFCGYTTDKDGRFTIKGVKPGTYQVFAVNEAEGYSMQGQVPWQEVTVTADQLWRDVTVQMRNPGGILVGSITDKFTGQTIREAVIHYFAIDSDSSGGSSVVSGEFHLPIRPDRDVVVIVTAHGYRGWVYTDAANPSRPVLKLASGERKEVRIELEPLPKESVSR